MNKKYFGEIEAIFDEKEAKEEAIRKKEEDRRKEEERRIKNFIDKRESIYKPILDDIKRLVEKRGMKCNVIVENEGHDGGQYQIKAIFNEEQNSSAIPEESLYFGLQFEKASNHVIIYENTSAPGVIGKRSAARYDIEGVTEDFLYMKLVKFLREIVGR